VLVTTTSTGRIVSFWLRMAPARMRVAQAQLPTARDKENRTSGRCASWRARGRCIYCRSPRCTSVVVDGRNEKSALYTGPTAALPPASLEREPEAVGGKKAWVDEPAVIRAGGGDECDRGADRGDVGEPVGVRVVP